jgi:hypothetical protein
MEDKIAALIGQYVLTILKLQDALDEKTAEVEGLKVNILDLERQLAK